MTSANAAVPRTRTLPTRAGRYQRGKGSELNDFGPTGAGYGGCLVESRSLESCAIGLSGFTCGTGHCRASAAGSAISYAKETSLASGFALGFPARPGSGVKSRTLLRSRNRNLRLLSNENIEDEHSATSTVKWSTSALLLGEIRATPFNDSTGYRKTARTPVRCQAPIGSRGTSLTTDHSKLRIVNLHYKKERTTTMEVVVRIPLGIASLIAGLTISLGVTAPIAQAFQPQKGAPQDVAGTGDGVPAFSPIDEPIIVIMAHDGASNFIVSPIGADGESGFSWANVIGPYSGTTLQEMGDLFAPYGTKNPVVAAEVKADGSWTLQVRKISQAPLQDMSAGRGTGDQVIRFKKGSSGFKRIVLTHLVSSNFIVKPVSSKGDVGLSLVNEIGQYKGTVRLPSGTKYLWVQADGDWSYVVS